MEEIFRLYPVSAIIFIFTLVTSVYAFYNQDTYGKFMLHAYSVARGKNIYQLITSGLVHKDWAHLGFNMLSFYFFAFELEQKIGSWQFGVLYFVSLILSDLPSVFKHKNNFHYHSLGASGAVCAVVFSFILFAPTVKLFIFPIPFAIPAIIYGLLFLVYTSYAGRKANDGINHDAHFFGALTGLIITIILVPGIFLIFLDQIQNGLF
jgi:membrane associated rhomboid family serine protease